MTFNSRPSGDKPTEQGWGHHKDKEPANTDSSQFTELRTYEPRIFASLSFAHCCTASTVNTDTQGYLRTFHST